MRPRLSCAAASPCSARARSSSALADGAAGAGAAGGAWTAAAHGTGAATAMASASAHEASKFRIIRIESVRPGRSDSRRFRVYTVAGPVAPRPSADTPIDEWRGGCRRARHEAGGITGQTHPQRGTESTPARHATLQLSPSRPPSQPHAPRSALGPPGAAAPTSELLNITGSIGFALRDSVLPFPRSSPPARRGVPTSPLVPAGHHRHRVSPHGALHVHRAEDPRTRPHARAGPPGRRRGAHQETARPGQVHRPRAHRAAARRGELRGVRHLRHAPLHRLRDGEGTAVHATAW